MFYLHNNGIGRVRSSNATLVFWLFTIVTVLVIMSTIVGGQIVNRPPIFVPGSGDMSRFSLSENTPVGSVVYQLKGTDPEGGALGYSISGPVFSVDRDTGVVRLRQSLDRETQAVLEVIISITDEGVLGTEPNTISLRREIPVRDYNDNPPVFHGRPYTSSISESTGVQSIIEVSPQIIVTDRDEGQNADITLSCYDEDDASDADVCETFDVATNKISEGNYTVVITLLKALDFETRASYVLTLMAIDGASTHRLSAFATVTINVIDVQDQPPVFVNAPYSTTISENSPEDTSVLTIAAIDGDSGNPRPIRLSIENEMKNHFKLEPIGEPGSGRAILYTTNNPIDREDPDILQNGGVYSFTVQATELINNEVPGDVSVTQVTVVLTDVDDHLPEFNEPYFDIAIPENLEQDTPLPGLSIYVDDKDLAENSRYNLSLRNVYNAENVFVVSPTQGEGRTPIVVKVVDSSKLDYDVENIALRNLTFDLIASVNGHDLSMSRITVNLQDANDNSPIFLQSSYRVSIEENSPIGTKIADIMATDKDSGEFGRISYLLKGFGSDHFSTDKESGGLSVKTNLDYEQQKSYSLSIVAVDGGGRETNAHLYVDVLDVNDNYPMFESLEYTRTIREGSLEFEPQFFVRAIDLDGYTQGDGRIRYSIKSENSISGRVFGINEETGEITILEPVNSMDTERGQYELIVEAKDYGYPPLTNTTRVQIRVGISGNQRPIFKGHFSTVGKGAIPGPPRFTVTIPETAAAGYNVTTVAASDPDGLDALLTYRIVGSNDNFIIGERSGLVQVSTVARLDRDHNPDHYAVVINAVDAGFPIPETATATLYINIKDINDKPPKFQRSTYTAYTSERTGVDGEIMTVTATDTDLDSKIRYSIIEPIKAASKTGTQLTSTEPFNYLEAFKIDPNTGVISVQNPLNHDLAAVIMLTIKAEDLLASVNKEEQFDLAEVIIYIQSFKDTNPIFKNKDWTSSNPVLNFRVKEEIPIGSTVFVLEAEDPVTGSLIQSYQMVQPDQMGFFSLHDRTGEVQLKKRLDYEKLNSTLIEFSVMARSNGGRGTTSLIRVTVENVNDNRPEFDQKTYRATVIEGTTFPTKVLTVHATDDDIVLTEQDKRIGFNSISYSLSGPNSEYFIINNTTGLIQIAPNHTLDREKQDTIKMSVIAEDSPGKPTETRKSSSEIIISVLDVNDNAPMFQHKSYSAVVPENSPINTFVVNTFALDPDEGPGGEIHYDLLNEGDAHGLLRINSSTGEIRTRMSLTGKGRSEPYDLVVRAQDKGEQISKQISLHTDVTFVLFIGDVSANDGIPFFISPKIGQSANISENATIGSPVFQVVAKDYDNPMSPNGQLTYRIQDDIEDAMSFRIDETSGLIITVKSLDREKKASYNIIVEVSDHGKPPQAATRVLRINVLDVDDHKPRFIREVNSVPIKVSILEEQPPGTVIGNFSAVDEDIDENGAIDYVIVDGNQEDIFVATRNDDNSFTLATNQKLDRETDESFLLTIKCFKLGQTNHQLMAHRPYNQEDFSLIQILIKLIDVDDHTPEFDVKNPAIGVRSNVAIDEVILHTHAVDVDPEALPIRYSIRYIAFVAQYYKRENESISNLTALFSINNVTGEIRTARSLSHFVDGYFELTVRANNSALTKRSTDNMVKIFVIRDKSLLRFVFTKPAAEVEAVVDEFAKRVQAELKSDDLELYILDTKVLTKVDHSLDFSSTSSCFQLSRHGSALSPLEMQQIMDKPEIQQRLLETYSKYSVSVVDSCSVKRNVAVAKFISTPGAWLVILAIFIGVSALIATCTACCMSNRYKHQSRLIQVRHPPPPSTHPEIYDISNPVMYTEPIYGPL